MFVELPEKFVAVGKAKSTHITINAKNLLSVHLATLFCGNKSRWFIRITDAAIILMVEGSSSSGMRPPFPDSLVASALAAPLVHAWDP